MAMTMLHTSTRSQIQSRAMKSWFGLLILLISLGDANGFAFQTPKHRLKGHSTHLSASPDSSSDDETLPAQAWSNGISTQSDLCLAIIESMDIAIKGLPSDCSTISMCWVSVSSLYDAGIHPPATMVLPTLRAAAESQNCSLENVIGSSVAGCIGSFPHPSREEETTQLLETVEVEGIPCVSVTLAVLPDVNVHTFALEEVPEPFIDPREWQRQVMGGSDDLSPDSMVSIIAAPSLNTELDDFARGLRNVNPKIALVGGLASTVSSLSRAKLYQSSCTTEGLVGVVLTGDLKLQAQRAEGAKPVGGVYRVVKGSESTIQAIVLDQDATQALEDQQDVQEDEDEEDAEVALGKKEQMQKAYAKATIPKPVLAEANFLMKLLSDDDQAFMRKQLLIGLERTGSTLTAADALLAAGNPPYSIHAVASGGMKDGSVTFALGSVDIQPGMRLRFHVRDADYAAQQVDNLWVNIQRKKLESQFADGESEFKAAACMVIPTLDRGQGFFGRTPLESAAVARLLPTVPCIGGYFSNGVVWGKGDVVVQGSACGYTLLGPKSSRPIYVPPSPVSEKDAQDDEDGDGIPQSAVIMSEAAPRSESGELILRRREVHAGRAMTVSTVEWSVAEKSAAPTSRLEEFMWEKETEVDRFRERVPLANLVSQCRLQKEETRSWTTPIREADDFVIIPECKRIDPVGGSLYRRYDIGRLVKEFKDVGAPALSVNCDAVLFGGKLEDISTIRNADKSMPPILASDLLLYPYQLYKLRLAGADAASLLAAALEEKDLLYLTKIANSLQLETLITVTSRVQLKALSSLPKLDGVIISNRDLEDFNHDISGKQAISLLESKELQLLREKHPNLLVLAEGRLGVIGDDGNEYESAEDYLGLLKEAGAHGGIMGGGLALEGMSLKKAQEMVKTL